MKTEKKIIIGAKVKQLKDIVTIRINLYDFFSNLFLNPPTAKIISTLKKDGFVDKMENLFGVESTRKIRNFLNEDSNLSSLIEEYNNLFKVPSSKYLTPFESCFLDEREIAGKRVKGLLMGPSTIAVRKEYENFGLTLGSIKELPDHIGVEFLFMRELCKKERENFRRKRIKRVNEIVEIEKIFLEKHLVPFSDGFFSKMSEKSTSDFYKGISNLASSFINKEAQTFLEITE